MAAKYIITIGQRFARWIVLSELPPLTTKSGRYVRARCDCGAEKTIRFTSLRSGETKSCGCLRDELASVRSSTHGHTRNRDLSPEYIVWFGMRQRCNYEKSAAYKHYGGRGISVSKDWESFEAFLSDMGKRPSSSHSIERRDVNGNYEKSNCFWATNSQQQNNKRTNKVLEFGGIRLTQAQWAVKTGITEAAIKQRIKAGWSIEDVLTRPVEVHIFKKQGMAP